MGGIRRLIGHGRQGEGKVKGDCLFPACVVGWAEVELTMSQRGSRWVMQETWVCSLGQEDPLERRMATHSSILAWRIPWTEEPGGLQSTGLQRVRHD